MTNFKRKAVDEFALIRRYFARPGNAPGVTTGIGDDGAVLQPEPGRELVVVIDTLVAGVHFPAGIDPFDIAYRAVAVNLSDIAAMGGRPRWMTLALTLPAAVENWLERFAEGLHAAAGEHAVSLVGGDTTYGKTLVISVQITGDVPSGKALLRSGAKVGDDIYVTGSVGDAAAGLELVSSGTPDNFLSARFLRPNARVAYGQSLLGVATAAIDLSDGLFADLAKLLEASGVGGVIELEQLPISRALRGRFDHDACRQFALAGGDDYELCFTSAMPPPQADGLAVTRIGEVTNSGQLVCRLEGELVPFSDSGYRHFQ
ncbi:MAG: thiamine-phosphate kinase [Proteobacteria bacterium]|nr:thiamine-phosphate kinase [Pseudomonadota bacterium]MDA1064458.1 thiamine-phosphate kinase [Pseudomonadota bacterium]